MATVLALVVVDMVTGIIVSKKINKKNLTSSGFKQTVGKLALYEIAVCIAYFVQTQLTGDLFPASKLVSTMIGLTEVKSILENIDIINGKNTFKLILARITHSEKALKGGNEEDHPK